MWVMSLMLAMPLWAQTSGDVEAITAEANARVAKGESQESVEAWMAQQMKAAGHVVEAKPANWDVFGRARWERDAREQEATPATPGFVVGNIARTDSQEPTGHVQRDAQDVLPTESPRSQGRDDLRSGSRGAVEQRCDPAACYLLDRGGVVLAGHADVEAGVHDSRITEKGDASLPKP